MERHLALHVVVLVLAVRRRQRPDAEGVAECGRQVRLAVAQPDHRRAGEFAPAGIRPDDELPAGPHCEFPFSRLRRSRVLNLGQPGRRVEGLHRLPERDFAGVEGDGPFRVRDFGVLEYDSQPGLAGHLRHGLMQWCLVELESNLRRDEKPLTADRPLDLCNHGRGPDPDLLVGRGHCGFQRLQRGLPGLLQFASRFLALGVPRMRQIADLGFERVGRAARCRRHEQCDRPGETHQCSAHTDPRGGGTVVRSKWNRTAGQRWKSTKSVAVLPEMAGVRLPRLPTLPAFTYPRSVSRSGDVWGCFWRPPMSPDVSFCLREGVMLPKLPRRQLYHIPLEGGTASGAIRAKGRPRTRVRITVLDSGPVSFRLRRSSSTSTADPRLVMVTGPTFIDRNRSPS